MLAAMVSMVIFGACKVATYGAEAFPSSPVTIVVPFPAGGTADFLPRVVADIMSRRWNQPVVIENISGAGGNIGAERVARAKPDGYTLLASAPGPLAINHNLYKSLPYDPTKFAPITVLGTSPNVLVVSPKVTAQSVNDLITLAKSNPGKVTYASQGAGSTSHLTASLFASTAGVELVHVPYKGSAPAVNDLLGGHVDIMFDNLASSLAQHRAGKLRILAVADRNRASALPDVPTIAESGFPGFLGVAWGGLGVPAGTYTLYVDVKDPEQWALVISKATGQWGLTYPGASSDLGRVKMTMSRPPAPVETLKYTLTDKGGGAGELRLEWEQHAATVPLHAK